VRGHIQDLDLQIALIRAQALQLILRHPDRYRSFQLLVSVKGIAQASAMALLGELIVLPAGMTARQWVAMAGLDPRHHPSGASVNKKSRISQAGNRYPGAPCTCRP
jgi:transposase